MPTRSDDFGFATINLVLFDSNYIIGSVSCLTNSQFTVLKCHQAVPLKRVHGNAQDTLGEPENEDVSCKVYNLEEEISILTLIFAQVGRSPVGNRHPETFVSTSLLFTFTFFTCLQTDNYRTHPAVKYTLVT